MPTLLFNATFLLFVLYVRGITYSRFSYGLNESYNIAQSELLNIEKRWQISEFPAFLKSCSMRHSSWEYLKNKYKIHILNAAVHGSDTFVISFLGSSVTAGHDSQFSQSFPVLVGKSLHPIFEKLNVTLISRNAAMGNNPCMPYDVCSKLFAGNDADIVHWEQTYNCGFGDSGKIIEQFIRQTLTIRTKPLIVFTDSSTPNWKEKDCVNINNRSMSHLSEHDKLMLSWMEKRLIMNVTVSNKDNKFKFIDDLIHLYQSNAHFQFFDHTQYEQYKCRGPYVPNWGVGVAKWHPSVLGHSLRASHHIYFWLSAWMDSIREIQQYIVLHRNVKDIDVEKLLQKYMQDITTSMQRHLDHHLIPSPKYRSNLTDGLQCFTNYEPYVNKSTLLTNLVVHGLNYDGVNFSTLSDTNNIGWKINIYESLVNSKLVAKSSKQGYLDYKVVLYGNNISGSLSLHISPRQEGKIFLCEAPGIWGKMISHFQHLWDSSVDVFITENVPKSKSQEFVFSADNAKQLQCHHSKSDELCMQTGSKVKAGDHIITLLPRTAENVILAFVIIP